MRVRVKGSQVIVSARQRDTAGQRRVTDEVGPPLALSTATRPAGQGRSPAERLVEPVGGLALLGGTDVAVDAGGDRVGRVPEVLSDDLGVRAGSPRRSAGGCAG